MSTFILEGNATVYGGKKDNCCLDFSSALETVSANGDWAVNRLTESLKSSLLPKLQSQYPDAVGFVRIHYSITIDGALFVKKEIPSL